MRSRMLTIIGAATLGFLGVMAPATAALADTTAAVTITSPSPDAVESDDTPTFRGTGVTDASVTVYDAEGYVLCAARVSAGVWSCESTRPMGDGRTLVFAEQNASGAVSRAQVLFAVDTAAATPALPVIPVMSAGVVFLLGLGVVTTGAVYVRRQRRHPSVP